MAHVGSHAFLVSRTGNELAPAYYVIAGAIVTTVVLVSMSETARRTLCQADEATDTTGDKTAAS